MKAPADAILRRMARLASREASLSSRGDARTTRAERAGGLAQCPRLYLGGLAVGQRQQLPRLRHRRAQGLGQLAHRVAEVAEESGDVAAGTREALHEAAADRIALEVDGDD